jgi:hypothetical protein
MQPTADDSELTLGIRVFNAFSTNRVARCNSSAALGSGGVVVARSRALTRRRLPDAERLDMLE